MGDEASRCWCGDVQNKFRISDFLAVHSIRRIVKVIFINERNDCVIFKSVESLNASILREKFL